MLTWINEQTQTANQSSKKPTLQIWEKVVLMLVGCVIHLHSQMVDCGVSVRCTFADVKAWAGWAMFRRGERHHQPREGDLSGVQWLPSRDRMDKRSADWHLEAHVHKNVFCFVDC